jgi:hypothetical protein
MIRSFLPVIPVNVLRRHRVAEPFDHRFRACARLLQSLWRAERALPMGSYTRASGATYKLGSLISDKAGDTGANFLLPEIARMARREVVYREPGALIEERRLWCNLLSSMPLTFNLLGLLRLNLKLATTMMRSLLPDLGEIEVKAVLFEHSPGRGHPELTDDYTAFDALVVYVRSDGQRGFVAIEVKYAESMTEPQKALKPRYEGLACEAGLHTAPGSPNLTAGPLQQFYRQHLLAQAMLMRRGWAEGTFLVLAPALNTPVQRTIDQYARTLHIAADGRVPFASVSLEAFIEQLRSAGERGYAAMLYRRYCDWGLVDAEIETFIEQFGSALAAANDDDEMEACFA